MPATLGAFRKLCPRVALNLFDMTSAEQFEALDGRKIDLGFVGLRPALSGRDLLSECVAHDTILVALPVRHPLARKAKLKLADLAAQFFIGMSAQTHSPPGSLPAERRARPSLLPPVDWTLTLHAPFPK